MPLRVDWEPSSGTNSRLKKLGTSTKEEMINRILRVIELLRKLGGQYATIHQRRLC